MKTNLIGARRTCAFLFFIFVLSSFFFLQVGILPARVRGDSPSLDLFTADHCPRSRRLDRVKREIIFVPLCGTAYSC